MDQAKGNKTMVDLKRSEIRLIEEFVAYPQGRGHVLEFSDRTILEFFEDELRIDFDDAMYLDRGTSKRNRLISFCLHENSHLVAKALRLIWEMRSEIVSRRNNEEPDDLKEKFIELVSRIDSNSERPSLDVINRYKSDRTLEELVASLERSIDSNKPEAALDHLHTYCLMKFTYLLSLEGIQCEENEALHARFGKYRKIITGNMDLHPISDLTMKSSISIFEKFNDVRNNWSLAHDNELLLHAEARYVFDSICAILRFVKKIEAGRFES